MSPVTLVVYCMLITCLVFLVWDNLGTLLHQHIYVQPQSLQHMTPTNNTISNVRLDVYLQLHAVSSRNEFHKKINSTSPFAGNVSVCAVVVNVSFGGGADIGRISIIPRSSSSPSADIKPPASITHIQLLYHTHIHAQSVATVSLTLSVTVLQALIYAAY